MKPAPKTAPKPDPKVALPVPKVLLPLEDPPRPDSSASIAAKVVQPKCICGMRGRNYLACPLRSDQPHLCDEWVKAHPEKLSEKVEAEKRTEKHNARVDEFGVIKELFKGLATQLEGRISGIEDKVDAVSAAALPDSATNLSGNKRNRTDATSGTQKKPRTTGSDVHEVDGEGQDDDSQVGDEQAPAGRTDSILRKGPLSAHTMSDADFLARLLDQWSGKAVLPE